MLEHAKLRDCDLVSHKEPSGSVVTQISASPPSFITYMQSPRCFQLVLESLKSDLVPLLCLRRRSDEERAGEEAS